jgi:hypothetical protein
MHSLCQELEQEIASTQGERRAVDDSSEVLQVPPRHVGQWAYRMSESHGSAHKVDVNDSVSTNPVCRRLVTLEWPVALLPVDDLYLILLDAGGKGNGFEDVMRFERSPSGRLEVDLDVPPGVYECKFMADGKEL